MFITPDRLLDAIILLIHDNGATNQALASELLLAYEDLIKTSPTMDSEVMSCYADVIRTLVTNSIDRTNVDQLRAILLKLKTHRTLEKRRDVFDLLSDIFLSPDSMQVEHLRRHKESVLNAVLLNRTNKKMRTAFAKLSQASELSDSGEQRSALMNALAIGGDLTQIFNEAASSAAATTVIDLVDMSDRAAVKQTLRRHADRAIRGVIKTGLHGLNRALGRVGGIARGRSMCFNALPHKYKSGMLLSAAIWTILYNDPPPDMWGKQVCYLASLENEVPENIKWMFRKAYISETGQSPDHLTDDEVEEWISALFNRRGYKLIIERHLPQNFGYTEFTARIKYFEELGYEVVLAVVDYLQLARKGSSEKASMQARDMLVQELFSNFCNFCKNRDITFVTAHPLNRKAQEIVSSQTSNAVHRFNADHLADSMGVEREVDISIYMHIEKNHAGDVFLTFKLTKHRYVDDTPEAHKTFAYKFHPKLGIIDDIHGRATFIREIYAADFDSTTDEEPSDQVAATAVF